jgi:multidrug transporter EmrE-like cation transporter
MIIYVFAIISAALLQIGTIYVLRHDFLGRFLYAVPFIVLYQFLFLWSYSKAPNFIGIWFIATAVTNVLAFAIGYFLWHEHASALNIAGIVSIIGGVILLNLK